MGKSRWELQRFALPLAAAGTTMVVIWQLSNPFSFSLPKQIDPAAMDRPPLRDTAVESFQRDCEKGVSQWRDGQLDYPGELRVSTNGATTYNAAIDIRDTPLPADQVIEVQGRVRTEVIEVKCVAAARLIPVGDHLSVEGPASDQWQTREFTPLGIVEWSWTVKAQKPVDQELRLVIRPALLMREESIEKPTGPYSAANEASVMTRVKIEANVIERVSYWFEVQWPLLVTIFGLLAVAVAACRQWLLGFKTKDQEPRATVPDKELSPKKGRKRAK